MQIEHYPATFDFRVRFPDARMAIGLEGGAFYAASDGPDAILIGDEGTMLGLLSEEDASDLENMAISVRRFPDAAALDTYLHERFPHARRLDRDPGGYRDFRA
jgi:hypothetical protein